MRQPLGIRYTKLVACSLLFAGEQAHPVFTVHAPPCPAQAAFERVVESAVGLEKLQGAGVTQAGPEVLAPIQAGMKVGSSGARRAAARRGAEILQLGPPVWMVFWA